MIKLEFETAVFLYLLIAIFGFLAAWFVFSKIKRRSDEQAKLESIWQCSICAYIYVDSKNKVVSLCPRCNSYNQRKSKGGNPNGSGQ